MNSIFNNYDLIFWDWNGTLLDDLEVCIAIINGCLAKRNLTRITRETYLDIFEFPVINYYRRLGFDFVRESFEVVGAEFIKGYSEEMFSCSLQSAGKELLQQTRQDGKKQFILSALHEKSLLKIISFFHLDEYFTEVRGLDDHYAWGKVELGKTLLNDSGGDPRRTLMIGDTLHDFEMARAIGIDCVLVGGGHNSIARLKTAGVPVFESLNELL